MNPRNPSGPAPPRLDLLSPSSPAGGQPDTALRVWLRLHALGYDPERLDRASVLSFCGEQLEAFLFEYGVYLPKRELVRVRRRISSFDPELPTAYERMATLSD